MLSLNSEHQMCIVRLHLQISNEFRGIDRQIYNLEKLLVQPLQRWSLKQQSVALVASWTRRLLLKQILDRFSGSRYSGHIGQTILLVTPRLSDDLLSSWVDTKIYFHIFSLILDQKLRVWAILEDFYTITSWVSYNSLFFIISQ